MHVQSSLKGTQYLRGTNHQTRECATNKRRNKSTRGSDRSRSPVRSGAYKVMLGLRAVRAHFKVPAENRTPPKGSRYEIWRASGALRYITNRHDCTARWYQFTDTSEFNYSRVCGRMQENLAFRRKLDEQRGLNANLDCYSEIALERGTYDRDANISSHARLFFCKMSIRGGGSCRHAYDRTKIVHRIGEHAELACSSRFGCSIFRPRCRNTGCLYLFSLLIERRY